MSTASEDSSPDQPQRTSHQPGPLAFLAATAIGGVLAKRLGKAPLIFAAGAAALALLKPKKTAAPPAALPRPVPPPQVEIPEQSVPPPAPQMASAAQHLPPTAPPPEIPVQSQVEQWLSRQISREAQAPAVDFSTLAVTPNAREDDYRPGSFLLDEGDEAAGTARADNDAYAYLTEPAPQSPPQSFLLDEGDESTGAARADNDAYASLTEPAPQPLSDSEAAPMIAEVAETAPPPPQVLQQMPPPPAMADGAWTLGVDPMPSLNEAAPYVAPGGGSMSLNPGVPQEGAASNAPEVPRSHLFSTAPVQQVEAEPPLFFATSVFQGAAFPDEIQVAPAFAHVVPLPPPQPPPAAWAVPPVMAPPPPAAAATPEIAVELAELGAASFDPPLAAAPANPWQPEPGTLPTPPAAPVQTRLAGTVVEAEIHLRPHAPTQNLVIAKAKFAAPSFSDHFTDNSNDTPPAEEAGYPGPPPSQRESKPRTTWRSWWRGD